SGGIAMDPARGQKDRKEDATMATPSKATLRDLVQVVSDYTTSDAEIVATVAYLINSDRVQLCGTFAGARIDLSALACAAPPSSTPHAGLAYGGRRDLSYAA